MSKSRKKYDRNFKLKAVELIEHRDSVPELAAELGVRPDLIYRWCRELNKRQEASFPGNGKVGLTEENLHGHHIVPKTFAKDNPVLQKAAKADV